MIRLTKNNNSLRVRVLKNLKIEDICGSEDFNFDRVVDTRVNFEGGAMPVEESILKRLRHFFIDYEQHPLDLDSASENCLNNFLASIETHAVKTLILTDRAKALGAFLQRRNIPACAEVVYFNPVLVEPNKAGIVAAQM